MIKYIFPTKSFQFLVFIMSLLVVSCKEEIKIEADVQNSTVLSEETKSYWYSGLAEITSYNLTQQRYGENRSGNAVLIYVTEDFDAKQLVKADQQQDANFPVLKLNSTKSFTTGIYPYHIMQSSFLPMEKNSFPAKITTSIQEWCGQSFMMLENKENYEIQINSYFQKIGNDKFSLQKSASENALLNQLRLFPTQIDTTITSMLPSFEFLRLYNKEVKAYEVKLSQQKVNDSLISELIYPELRRNFTIYQEAFFPNSILGWEESLTINDTVYTTKANKLTTMRIDYWNKNQEKFSYLRDSLQL